MTQFIAPNMAAAMQYSNRQGMMPSNQYSSGILSMAEGGLARKPYLFGGIKRRLKKLIPKEAAGIMQMAAPFVAPHSMLGAAALSGLGQYKSRGKINPLQLAMSVAPGLKGKHVNPIFEKFNRGTGIADEASVMRNLRGRMPGGQKMDDLFFGKAGTYDDPF